MRSFKSLLFIITALMVLIFHILTLIRQKDNPISDSIELSRNRKTLYIVFYFNILPADQGGAIMEYDWIVNFLLAKISRPVKILDKNEYMPRNDTLHVYLFNAEKDMFRRAKASALVNQGAFHMGDEKMENNIE